MFAYALLLSVVAATTYTQNGPTLSKDAASADAAAEELMKSEFTYENSRTDSETTVSTVNIAKGTSEKKFGTDLMKVKMVSCIKVDDTGRTCTKEDGATTETCTGKNKYNCTSVDATYTDATSGTGTIERFGSDVLEWDQGTADDNNTRQDWCNQPFTLATDGKITLGTAKATANCEDMTILDTDIVMSDSEVSVKSTYKDDNDGANYTTETSLTQVNALDEALKSTELYVEAQGTTDKEEYAMEQSIDMQTGKDPGEKPDDSGDDDDKDKDGASTFALAGATVAAAAFLF